MVFKESIWLNPFFAVNTDSVLNDFAMWLVCGVLKNVSMQYFTSNSPSNGDTKLAAVVPEGAIDSKAYEHETERHDEANEILTEEAKTPQVSQVEL